MKINRRFSPWIEADACTCASYVPSAEPDVGVKFTPVVIKLPNLYAEHVGNIADTATTHCTEIQILDVGEIYYPVADHSGRWSRTSSCVRVCPVGVDVEVRRVHRVSGGNAVRPRICCA